MKILLISPKMDKPNGGIAVWTEAYLASCEKRGADVSLVNTAAIGIRAEDGSASRNYSDEFKRTRRIFSDLKKVLARDSFDVAHVNSSCGTFGVIRDYLTAKRIKSKTSAKVITHFHCDIPYQIGNFISRFFLKRLVAYSDTCLVLCQNSKVYLRELCGVDSTLIPNFIDGNQIVSKKQISEKLTRAFYVGRVERAKGIAELLEAAGALPELSFDLAGAVSDEIRALPKPDNVTFLGALSHDEVLSYMDSADIFVFPTHSEGFSLALLESMARGLPSVATSVGANRDMIESVGGAVIEPKNATALVTAISSLCDSNMRAEISASSIAKVRENYTVDKVLDRLFELYRH